MYNLASISATLLQIAKAIEAALGVHVTIVDKNFKKIVSTQSSNLSTIDKGSANAHTLETRELLFIDNPREHVACHKCGNREDCKQFAEICAPIVYDNQVIGVIGLIAYNTEQKSYLINRVDGVKDFITLMSELITAKLSELVERKQLEVTNKELDMLIEQLDRAVIYCDMHGSVKRINQTGVKWLGINQGDYLDSTFMNERSHEIINNRTFSIDDKSLIRGMYDRYLITQNREPLGFVFLVESLDYAIDRYRALDTQPIVTTFDQIIGHSNILKEVIHFAEKAARTTSTILIQGESGTGKELFARAIHNTSPRASKAFVAINCGAIPESLLESELFGYEHGAFTGTHKNGKPGKFELAHGGTIFLDEIGDMPLNLQVKLLRVLQERVVERLGGKEPTPIDVRIICASHRDLERMVQEGEFREDLFYRIQVLPLFVPPLRDRLEDIPDLVRHLIRSKCERLNILRQISVSDQVLSAFLSHRWSGNIRELENVIEYALNVDHDGLITLEDLPKRFFVQVGRRASDKKFISLQQMEKEMIESAIAHYGSDREGITSICDNLGISRATLYRKMKFFSVSK